MDTIFEQDNYMMTFINGFEKGEQDYVLAIDVPTKYYKAKFKKNKEDNFVLIFTVDEEDDFNPEYFFSRPAVLCAQGTIDIILMNFDARSISMSLKAPHNVEVIYKSFTTELDPSKWDYSQHCAYYRYSKKDFRFTDLSLHYELTTNKNQHSSWRNAFVVKESSQNEILVSFEETIPGDDAYCVFRCQKAMSYQAFEKIIKAVLTSIGLLSGYYFGERAYYLSKYTGAPPQSKVPLVIRYINTSKSLKHSYPILDEVHYEDIDRKWLELTAEQYGKLLHLLTDNDDYQRAFRLLIDASSIDGISRGAIAAVALESIANNLNEKGTAAAIISNKEVASQLKYELSKVLKKIKPRIPKEEYNKIESKVGAVNIQPNAVKLESCFEKVGIQLTDEEKFCISCRNSFLHGGVPKNKDLEFLSQEDMVFMVSQRLIMLSAMLILKLAGYRGKVIDWGYTIIVKRRAIMSGSPFKKKGNAHRDLA